MPMIAVTALTREQILRNAPSVFAEQPSGKTSSRYAFVPTTQVINDLGQAGWMPVSAKESNVRDETKEGYQKHMVRFRHPELSFDRLLNVGDIIPEIVLTNSHDALSAFHLHAGIFRLVCSNGMVVADATIEKVSIKHVGYASQAAHNAGQMLFQNLPQLTKTIASMQTMQLRLPEASLMAHHAAMTRWSVADTQALPFDPTLLLAQRRTADADLTLWNVFQRIQENMIKGGVRYRTEKNVKQRTRRINSINEEIRVNKALWAFAESILELKRQEVA